MKTKSTDDKKYANFPSKKIVIYNVFPLIKQAGEAPILLMNKMDPAARKPALAVSTRLDSIKPSQL